jgi:hypothetical protein
MTNSTSEITLPRPRAGDKELRDFADALKAYPAPKISARGWGYQLETDLLITKGQLDRVEKLVGMCIKKGFLPVDFVLQEDARKFAGIEHPETQTPVEYMKGYLEAVLDCGDWYTPDWWDGERYYIQMIVEKIDLKMLFEPICAEYHIPIATTKGWSSRLQRAEYARRFKEGEERGLKAVLLVCGDFDPDGVRISDFIMSNLLDLKDIVWEDGTTGYDPTDLEIFRFGLNYDFIVENKLTWVKGLETSSGKDLALPSHKNHWMQYVQDWLKQYGAKKCEANAVLKGEERRAKAIKLCQKAIESYLGGDALLRFRSKRQEVLNEMEDMRQKTGLRESVVKAVDEIEAQEEE